LGRTKVNAKLGQKNLEKIVFEKKLTGGFTSVGGEQVANKLANSTECTSQKDVGGKGQKKKCNKNGPHSGREWLTKRKEINNT